MIEKVVVGVDGSPASLAALRMAHEIAGRFGAHLRAVETWEFTPVTAVTGGETDVEELQKAAEHRVARLVRETLGDEAAGTVECVAVSDAPEDALLREAEQADLLVVGSRGLGGVKGVLLGSVSRQLTTHAACPVLVVRPPAEG